MSYYYYFKDGEVRCVETSQKRVLEENLGVVLYKDKAKAENLCENWKNDRIINIREELVAVFDDWMNNFITVPAFADYYGLDVKDAQAVIDLGRKLKEKGIKL